MSQDFPGEVGRRQDRSELIDGGADLIGELHRTDRRMTRLRRWRESEDASLQLIIEYGNRRHFVPIVILRLHPENGYRSDAVIVRYLLSKLCRCQCFVKGEERSAKQACLLARDDRDAFRLDETRCRLARSCRRIPSLELPREDRAEIAPSPRMLLRVDDRGCPEWHDQ